MSNSDDVDPTAFEVRHRPRHGDRRPNALFKTADDSRNRAVGVGGRRERDGSGPSSKTNRIPPG
jgi:hypothetical protein